MQTRIHQIILMMAALALVATACGDSSADTAPPTEAPASTAAPTTQAPTTTSAPATTEAPPTTAATTTTSTSTTTTTTTIPLSDLPVLESAGSAVSAGTYASTSLSVPFRVRLPEGVDVQQGDGFIGIGPGGFTYLTSPTVTFIEFVGHPLPEQVPVHHPEVPPLVEISQAADWTRYFAETAGPTLLDSGESTIGGITAAWWDLTAEASGGFPDCSLGNHCFNVGYVAEYDGFFVIGEEFTVRLWKIDHADATIYAWYQAPSGMFADGLAFANGILDTVTVGG